MDEAKRALERVDWLLGKLVRDAQKVRADLKRIAGDAPRSMQPFDESDFVLHTALRSAVSAIDALAKAHAEIVAELAKGK